MIYPLQENQKLYRKFLDDLYCFPVEQTYVKGEYDSSMGRQLSLIYKSCD